jgi:NAD(P)-dependent dehydrogenase (short-subunit alcohol dehydrogenase family)
MTGKLNGKVAVITGGTTGIGFAAAQRFVAEGAKVIITGTNAATLDKARAELGTSVEVIPSDAASEQDVKTLFTRVHEKYGPRGIRVNAVSPGPIETPIFGKMGMPQADVQQMAEGIQSQIPLGRFGQPEEVAKWFCFWPVMNHPMCTDRSSLWMGG